MASVQTALSPWDKRSSQSVEKIYPGVTRIWLHKGQIVCYTLSTVARAAVDAWMQATEELIHAWPLEHPYLAIQDISEVTLTVYMRQKTSEVNGRMPSSLKGRSAVVMPRTFVNQMIRLFVTIELARKNPSVQRDVFFRIEEATAWLEAYRPQRS
jgi:hypothetical protein